MKSLTVINIIFLIVLSWASCHLAETITCTDSRTSLKGTTGTILIDRKVGCLLEPINQFFGIKTQNLQLNDDEYITVKPGKSEEKEFNLSGPNKVDYYVFGYGPQLLFKLKPGDGIMLIDYFQGNDSSVPINLGSRGGETLIQAFGQKQFEVELAASDVTEHVHVLNTNSFNHHLIEAKQSKKVPVSGDLVSIASVPVRKDCSNTYTATSKDSSFKIEGPNGINEPYTCVNIFQFADNSDKGSHFDVDFANFSIVSQDDQLLVDDGHQVMIVNRFSKLHPIISFQGPNLAVIYGSPRAPESKSVYKLGIESQTIGGVIDGYQALNLPSKGIVRYTFRSQNNDALEITGKLGVGVKIYDAQNNILTIGDKYFNPPVLSLPQNAVVEFNVQSKTSATVNYKQDVKKCSGIIFDSSGTISISGGDLSCYWLIGERSTIRVDTHNLQHEKSCLTIYSLEREAPVFNQCNIDPGLVLPPFTLGPAYIKIEASSTDTKFVATISKALDAIVSSTTGLQTRYSSASYPTSYLWSPFSENFSIDSKNKSVVLAVADVDIRKGEKLTINSKEVNGGNYLTFGDFDAVNSTLNVALSRSLETNDFLNHKGYSLVATSYQNIVKADVSEKSILTQKDLTSLLVRIVAAEKERIAYSITNVTSNNQDFVMNVIDSRSVVGRPLPDEEKYNSSTTSNTLLLSLYTLKANTTLPQFKIAFNRLACNETTDHVCDQSTRCVPAAKLCKGKSYCLDSTDLRVQCSSGPTPRPPVITNEGYSGLTVFFLSNLMFALGVVAAIYGPDAYKNLESRFRSGQYTTFTSTE